MDSIVSRRSVALWGAVVAVLYVIASSISSSLSPLARLPLLDGVHTAAPYNWVATPAGEQGTETPPAAHSMRLDLAATGNAESTAATGDAQASLSIPAAAIKPAAGRRQAEVKIEPLDPSAYAPPPDGYVIRGNIYRIALRDVPGGAGIQTLGSAGQLTLRYAAPTTDLLKAQHDIMFSSEGQQWRMLGAQDQHGTQMVSAPMLDIGYFAPVARVPEDEPAEDGGGSFPWIVPVVILVAVGAASVPIRRVRRKREAIRRRERIRAELARKSRSTKKRRR